MSSRCNFFHRQRVTESELDLAFDQLEQADHDFASDVGVYGIIGGGEPTQHHPVPNMTIDLTAPCIAYDHLGQRIFFATEQQVDCSQDHEGIPTDVSTPGNERWLGIFLKFDRALSDPRTDGNSQQVYFRRDESFQLLVRQGPEAAEGSAQKVPLEDSELLVCDIKLIEGKSQIFDSDIDLSRRQNFIFAEASAIEALTGGWGALSPQVDTVQQALDSADEILSGHLDGTNNRHNAADVDYSPVGFVQSTDMQAAIDEVANGIAANTGAALIGTEPVTGIPNILSSGNVQGQLSQLLEFVNSHVSDILDAHPASAIGASPHLEITGTTVQQQLEQLLTRMMDSLATHNSSGDHDSHYYPREEADSQFYNVGEKVGDADTLDTKHASEFAEATHQHDARYLRKFGHYEFGLLTGESETFIANSFPTVVDVKYRRILPGGSLDDDYIVNGTFTGDIKVHFREVTAPQGYTYYQAEITNESSQNMRVYVNVYTVDAEE